MQQFQVHLGFSFLLVATVRLIAFTNLSQILFAFLNLCFFRNFNVSLLFREFLKIHR